MKVTETVKEYSEKLLNIANKVRLLGSCLVDSRIVEKILVTIPKRFEATITTLENMKDMSNITLEELLSSLQAQEQKCVVGYKYKNQQQGDEAQVANQKEEDQLFVATCFTSHKTSESWLIDSGCTNYMTHDSELFKELKSTESKKVIIGTSDYIVVKGKGTIAITSCSSTKFITDVLYVFDIDQNLLSVGQLVEKGFKVKFMEKTCMIEDALGQKMFEVKMVRMSFSLNPMQEEQSAFLSKESLAMLWHKRSDTITIRGCYR
ncbi:uncharacterized protein [Gossypium hirsutum]|uniref:Retrovirus-related Pol polyprotein from transposon TNT 1-94-like beta-barrel domain-containing protein n=1 Tax=Gossypium hirsutum TaxID=3635 RepID=A0A1U8P7D2_GOSHI|nr:uncharacterized protein LOC107955837 [Gossypium hirsutum]